MPVKRLILTAALLLCGLYAESQTLDSLIIEARGSWLPRYETAWSSRLSAEYFNIDLGGTITPELSFRIRQRMNIPIDKGNPFRATDLLSMTWAPTPKLTLTAGKTAILIGGYEYDSAPIDVYFYSQFCNNLSQCFAFGLNAGYEIRPGQSIVAQISNSPLSSGFDDIYAYNLAWSGHMAKWWKTTWSCNFVEDPYHRFMNYQALGNHLTFGRLALDFDLFHRASFKQEKFIASDYSFITKAILTLGKWYLCFKAGHEYNSADNVDADGLSYDTVITAGTQYFYGGWGIEYLPLGDDTVRLHFAYYRDTYENAHNITMGLKWKMSIIKR